MAHDGAANAVTLSDPGRILDVVERCIAARVGPGRCGWSAAAHLGRDLERHYAMRVPTAALERALRQLAARRRIRRHCDSQGVVWYRAG